MYILSLISLICLLLAIILHCLNYYDVLVKINIKLYSLGFNLNLRDGRLYPCPATRNGE